MKSQVIAIVEKSYPRISGAAEFVEAEWKPGFNEEDKHGVAGYFGNKILQGALHTHKWEKSQVGGRLSQSHYPFSDRRTVMRCALCGATDDSDGLGSAIIAAGMLR